MFDLLEIVPRPGPIRVVDVGAMHLEGLSESYTPLVQRGLAQVLGFEPIPEECQKLNTMARPGHRYLPHVIGDGTPRTFHICNWTATSSIYEPNTELLARFQNLENLTQVVRTEPVQTVRLDDVPEAANTDFLKMDVQGAEADVLRGATRVLADALLVQVEVEFVPLYRNQPLFAEVDQSLRQGGFLFHRFLGFAGRTFQPLAVAEDVNCAMSQQLWAEAVYVRNFMELNRLRPEQLLKLAVALHMVYSSYDLVAVALREYDLQMGTSLQDAYVNRLIASQPKPPTQQNQPGAGLESRNAS